MSDEQALATVKQETVGEALAKQDVERAVAKPAPTNIMPVSYDGIAVSAFSKEAQTICAALCEPSDIEIKPDGIVYLPADRYRHRLNKAFGIGAWAQRPVSAITNMGNVVYREFALYILGRFVSQAMGHNEYQPDNKQMNWADCVEGAQSIALSRCCKPLGIGEELFDKTFQEEWKRKYAVQVWRKGKDKPQWRRKDREAFYDETGFVAQKGGGADSARMSQAKPLVEKVADMMQGSGAAVVSQGDAKASPAPAPSAPAKVNHGDKRISRVNHGMIRVYVVWDGQVEATKKGNKCRFGLSESHPVGGSPDGRFYATLWMAGGPDGEADSARYKLLMQARKTDGVVDVLIRNDKATDQKGIPYKSIEDVQAAFIDPPVDHEGPQDEEPPF